MSPISSTLRGRFAPSVASSGAPTTPAALAEMLCPAVGMSMATPAAIRAAAPS